MSTSCRVIFSKDRSFMMELARRQGRICFVIAKEASKRSWCEATNFADYSLTPPIAFHASVYRKRRPCPEKPSKRRNPPPFKNTNTKIGNLHHYLSTNETAFNSALIFKQTDYRPDTSMLAKYYARFMSSATSSVLGADVGQVENNQVADLLSNPKTNKTVTIKACGKLYSDLTKTRPILYSGAPTDGIQFEVQYYDSLDLLGPTNSQQTHATVCLLHGAPGHYKDFISLINYLASKGIRAIAPNFPDYSATFNHRFRHSPHERLDFIVEFFKAISVTKYDMVIGHSSAVYTLYELLNYSLNCEDNSAGIQIRSLGLFSTPSHVLPHNLAVTPSRLFFLKLFDYPLLRPFVMTFVKTFVAMQGIRNRVDRDKIENLLIAASAMGYADHARMANHLRLAQHNKVPTLLVYGTRDRLITRYNFIQLERDLGIDSDDQVRRYNSDGLIEREAKDPKEIVEVSRFESGGHYTFQKYSSQVNKDVLSFLTRHVLGTSKVSEATRL